MARYIDADALIEELKSLSITVTGLINGKGYLSQIVKEYKDSILRIIDEQPTADVVPKSELAREIFEELERWLGDYNGCRVITYEKFAELKKKYLEEEK